MILKLFSEFFFDNKVIDVLLLKSTSRYNHQTLYQLTKNVHRKMLFSKLTIILTIFLQIFKFCMSKTAVCSTVVGMNEKSILRSQIRCKPGSVYRIRKCRYLYKWK